jgi:hypothetical protein
MAEVFEVSDDTNFIQVKISSEKELFYRDIHNEILINPQELPQLLEMNRSTKIQTPCLSAYINQAKYPRDSSKKQKFLTDIVKNFIHNYFL